MFAIFHCADNFSISNVVNHFDAWLCILDSKTIACKDVLVAFGMKVGKPASKFEFITGNLYLSLCIEFAVGAIVYGSLSLLYLKNKQPVIFRALFHH